MAVGFKYVGNEYALGNGAISRKYQITASTAIAKGDALQVASGLVLPATSSGEKIVGIANESVTGNSAGTTSIDVITARPGDLYIADNDNVSTAFAATHIGTYFDLTGATGAQQLDTDTTATTGQFYCIDYNPQGHGFDSDTSIALVKIAESVDNGRTA